MFPPTPCIPSSALAQVHFQTADLLMLSSCGEAPDVAVHLASREQRGRPGTGIRPASLAAVRRRLAQDGWGCISKHVTAFAGKCGEAWQSSFQPIFHEYGYPRKVMKDDQF